MSELLRASAASLAERIAAGEVSSREVTQAHLDRIAALKNGPFCVGFAAESRNLEAYAQAKRRKKNIPLIAGNLIQDGFGGDDNRIVLFDDNGTHPLTPAPKLELARQLVARIASLLENR